MGCILFLPVTIRVADAYGVTRNDMHRFRWVISNHLLRVFLAWLLRHFYLVYVQPAKWWLGSLFHATGVSLRVLTALKRMALAEAIPRHDGEDTHASPKQPIGVSVSWPRSLYPSFGRE